MSESNPYAVALQRQALRKPTYGGIGTSRRPRKSPHIRETVHMCCRPSSCPVSQIAPRLSRRHSGTPFVKTGCHEPHTRQRLAVQLPMDSSHVGEPGRRSPLCHLHAPATRPSRRVRSGMRRLQRLGVPGRERRATFAECARLSAADTSRLLTTRAAPKDPWTSDSAAAAHHLRDGRHDTGAGASARRGGR